MLRHTLSSWYHGFSSGGARLPVGKGSKGTGGNRLYKTVDYDLNRFLPSDSNESGERLTRWSPPLVLVASGLSP